MQDITPRELKNKMDRGDAFHLIDVREPHEHSEFNIGGDLAPLQTALPMKIQEMAGREHDEIVVYCRSGARSSIAKQMFVQAGFTQVRNLLGGILGWKESFPA